MEGMEDTITDEMITAAIAAYREEMREPVAKAIFCTRHDPDLWGDERFPKDCAYAFREADAAFDAIAAYSATEPCGRILVGQGTDTWDPNCVLPSGHAGACQPESEES